MLIGLLVWEIDFARHNGSRDVTFVLIIANKCMRSRTCPLIVMNLLISLTKIIVLLNSESSLWFQCFLLLTKGITPLIVAKLFDLNFHKYTVQTLFSSQFFVHYNPWFYLHSGKWKTGNELYHFLMRKVNCYIKLERNLLTSLSIDTSLPLSCKVGLIACFTSLRTKLSSRL